MFRSLSAQSAFAIAFCVVALASGWASADDELATTTPQPRTGAGWRERQERINERAKQGDVDLLFIGDSITQGWERPGKTIWKKFYGDRNAMNAGISGDRTQHVLWRLDHGNLDGIEPKLAVIMIGTNNAGTDSPDDIAAGITAIVAKVREKLPETKVLLLGIFPRGPNSDDPARQVTVATNKIIKSLDDGESVFFLDIADEFLESDGTLSEEIMPDLVHLNVKGYEIWGESIEPKVAELMGED